MKREDLIPFSFGGNKARKAKYFFDEIDRGNFDSVVTYGSGSSNHCRIISNMAKQRGLECYIISPKEAFEETFNQSMMNLFDAKIQVVSVNEVSDTIEKTLESLKNSGKKPYFIQGGGHGNLGTRAYVDCYEEIKEYEKENGITFDYIFFASGTGTTQAGLVCGKLINNDNRKIVGISIARKNPRGRDIVLSSIYEYFSEKNIEKDSSLIEESTIFVDDYVGNGYGNMNDDISKTIENMISNYGIPMDSTYTAKAYNGMEKYIEKNNISGKNILFIHTGGTPLFFDYLKNKNI
jgi:hypothetical protein